jgi:SsrA-binding protein
MKLISNNRKANFEYFLLDKFEAGIVLHGSEVKSLRSNQVSLEDAFVVVRGTNVWLKNLYIKPYEKATSFSVDPRIDRKLLLNKKEILKLERETKNDGLTIIPTKIYFSNNLVKLEIAVAKGKKLYDKRESIKQKELAREKSKHIYA